MSKMKKRTKRILKAIFIPIACITIFFLLNFLLNAAAEPRDHVSPDYAKTDLNSLLAKDSLSDSDYELLYRQTGLGKPAVQDLLLLPDGREKIQQFQADFFRAPRIECKQNSLTAFQESLTDEAGGRIYGFQLAPIKDGDILLTRSMHSFGWRHGHAALVTSAAAGQTLEAISLGVDSTYQSTNGWRDWPTFMLLRPKPEYREKAAQAVAFANEHLAGIPYNLVRAFLPPNSKRLPAAHSARILFGKPINPLGSTLIPTAGRLSRLRIWPTANISMWYRCTEWTLRRYGRKCSRTDRLTIQASPQGQPILRGCLFIILRSIVTLYRASIPALCHHPLCNKKQA